MKLQPMLCQIKDEPFDSADWLYEPKFDGVRILAIKEKEKVGLFSRYFKSKNLQFPQIVEALKRIKKDFILDGEICALDKKGIPRFQLIQDLTNLQEKSEIERLTKEKHLVYYVFDCLEIEGKDLKNLPLVERKNHLENLIKESSLIQRVDFISAEGKEFFQKSLKKGFEGIIAKKKSSLYQAGRSSDWLKIKGVLQQEVVIGGYTAGLGARKDSFGALLLGLYKDDKLQFVGHTGTGFNEKTLQDLLGKLEKIRTSASPFTPPPQTNEKAFWVRPELVAQVKFAEWTRAKIMRQPVFLGLRDDKKPRECRFEM